MSTVKEIVQAHLAAAGYDGLTDEDECACELADLMPCGNPNNGCAAAYRVPCVPEECDSEGGKGHFHMRSAGLRKPS